ncbi:hypothetical protein [Gulosibacter sediminis]|uniref:hypothetical protein n=1 Tax=Gulosibacter sediminis TaxID=1729695 RepID=UPI0024A93B61|nr:hypothetical protein [Gulosibacter sediminis]
MSTAEIVMCIAGALMLVCAVAYLVMGYWLGQEKRAYREMRHAAHDVIERTAEVNTFLYEMWALGYDRHEAIHVAKKVALLGLTVEQLERIVEKERATWLR